MCGRTKLSSMLLLQLISVILLVGVSAQGGSKVSDEPLFDCITQDPSSSDEQVLDPSTSPVRISVSSSTFYPGQEISVSLISNYPLKAYMLQARSDQGSGGDSSEGTRGPQGWWPQDPQAFRCLSTADTLYYSSEDLYVTKVKAMWTTNSASVPGEIYFQASFVAADGKIWTNVKSFSIRQIKQSDITTETAKLHTTKRPGSGSTVGLLPSNSTPSVEYRLRQSIIDERIVELELRNQKLLLSDDSGNEGDWSAVRERARLEHKNHFRLQLVANKKKKQEDEKRRQEILRFEIADKESHGRVAGGGDTGATKPPPKPIESAAVTTVQRGTALMIFALIFTWFSR